VIKALETRTSASKPYTVADMPPHAGPLGRINIPYDSEQYRDLLEWLYSKHKSQPSGNLVDALKASCRQTSGDTGSASRTMSCRELRGSSRCIKLFLYQFLYHASNHIMPDPDAYSH